MIGHSSAICAWKGSGSFRWVEGSETECVIAIEGGTPPPVVTKTRRNEAGTASESTPVEKTGSGAKRHTTSKAAGSVPAEKPEIAANAKTTSKAAGSEPVRRKTPRAAPAVKAETAVKQEEAEDSDDKDIIQKWCREKEAPILPKEFEVIANRHMGVKLVRDAGDEAWQHYRRGTTWRDSRDE